MAIMAPKKIVLFSQNRFKPEILMGSRNFFFNFKWTRSIDIDDVETKIQQHRQIRVCQVVKIADKSLLFSQAKKLVQSFCYLLKSALLLTHSAWKSNYCDIKWMRGKRLNQL